MKPALVSETENMSCLIIPLGKSNLLLPNVTVAEILPWRKIKKWDLAPQWCLGLIGWRGETVPVVRFEKLNDENFTTEAGRCLLIMNRTQAGSARAFYGLAIDGLPRLVRFGNDDLKNISSTLKIADAAHLQVGLEQVTVPRLSYLEEQLGTLPDY